MVRPRIGSEPPSDMDSDVLGVPSSVRTDHTLRSELTIWLVVGSPRWKVRTVRDALRIPGISRSDPAKPSHSVPTLGAANTDFPVAALLYPMLAEYEIWRVAGNSRV